MKKRLEGVGGCAGFHRIKKYLKGFSLTELMIVVSIIGFIAAFAIPGYGRMVRKSHERNAILGLLSIHSANEIFDARNGQFVPGAGLNLAQINTDFSINVQAADLIYSYTRTAPALYRATAAWPGGTNAFTVRVDQRPIDLNGDNPCCFDGVCPTRPACP